ncbi:MAG: hypothetical protein IJL06_02305 [Kiritimatiellae bacterium]|nr:hypothetical protein [Kiritimatiellia bacterium]
MKNAFLPAALAALLLLPAATRADDDGDDVATEDAAAAAAGSFSFGKPKTADPSNLVTVQAKGRGETVEAAKKDAIRNAVKKAVGELVDAKTLVENDELVSDRILTLSNAMVEKADYGDAVSAGEGLFEVPVTAVVKKGRLNRELEKIGISTGSVSGSSLAAALFSGRERVANAEKFFAERLKDFPGNVVEAVMLAKKDGTPDIEIDADQGHVYANVGLRVNMANYSEWSKQLQEVLGAVCLKQEKANLKFGDRPDDLGFVASDPLKLGIVPETAMVAVVATPAAEKVRRSTWPAAVYYLDASMAKAFASQMAAMIPEQGALEIVLEDEDGEPVCSKMAGLETSKYAYGSPGENNLEIDLGNKGGYGFACIPARAKFCQSSDRIADRYAFVVPALNPMVNMFRFELDRPKDLTAKFRIDLGEVSEDDADAVRGFQVKIEFDKPRP